MSKASKASKKSPGKPTLKQRRAIQPPQRSNGKARVAAILEAGVALIEEFGYEGTTMAAIAARSKTKIGSLYRFFPNKEGLAETILSLFQEQLEASFNQFDAQVHDNSPDELANGLMNVITRMFAKPAFRQLLDGSVDFSSKREVFRRMFLKRIAKTLKSYDSSLTKASLQEIALVILLNAKTIATHQRFFAAAPGVPLEMRKMTSLYIRNKLKHDNA